MNYIDLINVVLFPEIFDTITVPICFFPTHSTKQAFTLKTKYDNVLITIYPGKYEDELYINETKYTILKNKKYMKDILIYACSIQIEADTIIYEKQVKKNIIRTIYQPTLEFKENINEKYIFKCINFKSIKIIRHVQFVPHQKYQELFNIQKGKIDNDVIQKFYNHLNILKYAN